MLKTTSPISIIVLLLLLSFIAPAFGFQKSAGQPSVTQPSAWQPGPTQPNSGQQSSAQQSLALKSARPPSPVPIVIQQGPEWETFNSPEGRFSILTPTKPKVEVKEVDSEVGKLTLYTYASNSRAAYFMVSYADYPIDVTGDRREAVLDGVRGGVIKGIEGELISEKKITITSSGGEAATSYPGREFYAAKTIEGSETVFTWRIYLVGRRLYQMVAATTKANSTTPDIQKYLTSFELTN
jgi:hypothetical protein